MWWYNDCCKTFHIISSVTFPSDLELSTISTGTPTPTIYYLVYISSDKYIQINFIISLNGSTATW